MDTARAAVRLAGADQASAPAARQTVSDAWPSVFRAYAAEPLAQRPVVFTNCKTGQGIGEVGAWIQRELLFG